MPRERECYRDNLANLRDRYPGKEAISLNEAAAYLGAKRERLLGDETFPWRKLGGQYIVVLVNFARWLSA